MKSRFSLSALLVGLLFVNTVFAEGITIKRDDPEEMLKQATDALLALAIEAKSYVEHDRARYYREGEHILNQVIDREYFARGVMANYASARQYQALKTEAEKQAFRERVSRFADIMQEVLIEKYADALLMFNGQRIEVDEVMPLGKDGKRVNVRQLVHGDKVYTVQYNLHQDEQGKWLMYNVVVEGVNLGSTFRTQFAEAVEKNRGDVDYVVNNWDSVMSQGHDKQ